MRRSRSCKLLLFGGRCVKVHGCLSLRTKLLLLLLLLLQWNRARSTIQNTESSLYPHRLFYTLCFCLYQRKPGLENIFENIKVFDTSDICDIFYKMKISNKLYNNGCKTLMQYQFPVICRLPYVSLLSVIAVSLRKFFL